MPKGHLDMSKTELKAFQDSLEDMVTRLEWLARQSEEMVESVRDVYKACEPFLSTTPQPLEENSTVKAAKAEALKNVTKSLAGIDLLEVIVAREKELQRDLDRDE